LSKGTHSIDFSFTDKFCWPLYYEASVHYGSKKEHAEESAISDIRIGRLEKINVGLA
jgi:hypothetical protein